MSFGGYEVPATVGPKDGTFTLQYRSAIAFGKAERVTDTEEKIEALRVISQSFSPKHMDAFDEAVQRSLIVRSGTDYFIKPSHRQA